MIAPIDSVVFFYLTLLVNFDFGYLNQTLLQLICSLMLERTPQEAPDLSQIKQRETIKRRERKMSRVFV